LRFLHFNTHIQAAHTKTMLSYCIFWLTIISFYIIFCESASFKRSSSFFSGGRWRPGRPLKRSILSNNFGCNTLGPAENHLQPQAPPSSLSFPSDGGEGVAENLGPKIGEHLLRSLSTSKIVYLPNELLIINSNNDIPMFAKNGYESVDDNDGSDDQQQFYPFEKDTTLDLMLKNGEKYIKNQAFKPQPYITIENNSDQQQQEEEEVKPPSIFKTTALSTAPRL
jgi:hypothetical protein